MKTIKFKTDAQTDLGCVRTNNEDNFILCPDLETQSWIMNDSLLSLSKMGAVFVVTDGMGGTNAGEVASQIAIDTVKELFEKIDWKVTESQHKIEHFLCDIIREADKNIISHGKSNPETQGMGTTIVISWLLKSKLHTAWCGDSRAYIFHKNMGIKAVSKDHSYVQELVDKGTITEELAFYHPDSNIITRSLGSLNSQANPDVVTIDIYNGFRILLCSDGLNGMLTDKAIAEILDSKHEPRECLVSLIDAAKQKGGHDNITVVVCDVVSGCNDYKAPISNEANNNNIKPVKKSKKIIITIAVTLIVIAAFFGGMYFDKIPAVFNLNSQDSIGAEQERIAAEKTKQDSITLKIKKDSIAKVKKDSIAKIKKDQKIEQERIIKEKAKQEERIETERIAKEIAEQNKIAEEQKNQIKPNDIDTDTTLIPNDSIPNVLNKL